MTQIATQKLLIDKHQKKWPVQVVPIANDLGINVFRRSDWPNNISGRIFRAPEEIAGESGYAIEVNGTHHINRRRFTIAHEIAHFVLHINLIGDGIYDDGLYRSGLSNRIEAQANKFAQRILMPDHLMQEAISEHGSNPRTLANMFQVSEAAMRIRLGLPPIYD